MQRYHVDFFMKCENDYGDWVMADDAIRELDSSYGKMLDYKKSLDNVAVERDAAQSRIAELEAEVALMSDPQAVFVCMMSGNIALPTWDQIKHVYPNQSSAERDTAWNDAIEAAAEVFKWNECDLHPKMRKHVIGLIRALRR